jgi:hypothetical protein
VRADAHERTRRQNRSAKSRGRTSAKPQVPFVRKLVLNQWLLSLFNVKRLEELAEHLRQE